ALGGGRAGRRALHGKIPVLDEALRQIAPPAEIRARGEDPLQRSVVTGRLIGDVALPRLFEEEALARGIRDCEARIDARLDGTPPQERRREGVDGLDRRSIELFARLGEARGGLRVRGRPREDLLQAILDPGPHTLLEL